MIFQFLKNMSLKKKFCLIASLKIIDAPLQAVPIQPLIFCACNLDKCYSDMHGRRNRLGRVPPIPQKKIFRGRKGGRFLGEKGSCFKPLFHAK